jgi:protein-tyrosine-phosphatase
MKFVTRENPKVDRIACPWLIRKFIDPAAELLFVPADQVITTAEREGALPYDVPGADLGHHNGGSSFDSFIRNYELNDPGLLELAKIVRAADTQDTDAAPEGAGLRQIANGWHLLDWPLQRRLDVGFAIYDCLYAVCQQRVGQKTLLFVCPHNAAKSLIAAVYFNQQAQAAGLSYRATSAGTEPSEAVSPIVVEMLGEEGLDVSQYQPRHIAASEWQFTSRIISIGCTPDELRPATGQLEYWDDVPMISKDPQGSRDAIRRHITQLVEELKNAAT